MYFKNITKFQDEMPILSHGQCFHVMFLAITILWHWKDSQISGVTFRPNLNILHLKPYDKLVKN